MLSGSSSKAFQLAVNILCRCSQHVVLRAVTNWTRRLEMESIPHGVWPHTPRSRLRVSNVESHIVKMPQHFIYQASRRLLPFVGTSTKLHLFCLHQNSCSIMAININDEFSEIIGIKKASERIESFVWITLAQKFEQIQDHSAMSPLGFTLAEYLKKSRFSTNEVSEGLKGLAPEHSLSWITDNRRQSLWIERNIGQIHLSEGGNELNHRVYSQSPRAEEPSFVVPHHLLGRSRSVAIIDYWTFKNIRATVDKVAYINRIQLAWQRHIKVDRHFAWLDDGNTEKRRGFFWGWLESRDYRITQNQTQFNTHDEVLEFFDHPIFTDAARELFSKSAKKSWDQQQRRENTKDKRQCNFVLTERTICKLEALAHKHGLTRTEIIEIMIESEAKRELYITERLNRKSLLVTPLE